MLDPWHSNLSALQNDCSVIEEDLNITSYGRLWKAAWLDGSSLFRRQDGFWVLNEFLEMSLITGILIRSEYETVWDDITDFYAGKSRSFQTPPDPIEEDGLGEDDESSILSTIRQDPIAMHPSTNVVGPGGIAYPHNRMVNSPYSTGGDLGDSIIPPTPQNQVLTGCPWSRCLEDASRSCCHCHWTSWNWRVHSSPSHFRLVTPCEGKSTWLRYALVRCFIQGRTVFYQTETARAYIFNAHGVLYSEPICQYPQKFSLTAFRPPRGAW